MDESAPRTARLLGYAGLIPFGLLVAVAIIGAPETVERVLIGYGLAILSFLCGSLWMFTVQREDLDSATLILSNALVLAGLPALLLPLPAACLLLALLFAIHGLLEWRRVGDALPRWYRGLRRLLSPVVVALLVLAAVAWIQHG